MARRSKGFSELLNQQRPPKDEQKVLEKFRQKVQQGSLKDQVKGIVTNAKGQVKMSEVLEEFIEPYLDKVKNRSQHEKLLGIAVCAWNLALTPEKKRKPLIDDFVKKIVPVNDSLAEQDTRKVLNELITRKTQLFADNRRYIVDFQLQDMGKSFYLTVASTFVEPSSLKK